MATKRKYTGTVNEGIQADHVSAHVIAVGRGAIAKHVTHVKSAESQLRTEHCLKALVELRRRLEEGVSDPSARAAIEVDIRRVNRAACSKRPNKREVSRGIAGILRKLRGVGIVLREATALAKPLKQIGSLFNIPMKFLE
jgi:hypothetical protein